MIRTVNKWGAGGAVLAAALICGGAQAAPIYLNIDNISVSLGSSHDADVLANPTYGPFQNVTINNSLNNIIDAPSSDAVEFHTQTTHVWVSGGHLELDFDLGVEYDLSELHFWNYHSEGFDVDNILFTFFDDDNVFIDILEVQPVLGNTDGSDGTPITPEDYALSFPTNVRYVNAWLTGSNNQVDFNNIGFTAELSDPNPDPGTPSIPAPLPLAIFGMGLMGMALVRRKPAA